MTEMENAVGTLTDPNDLDVEQGSVLSTALADDDCEKFEYESTDEDYGDAAPDERAEYERLIKKRFKRFYTEDTQRMINKRFKRYKAMEERLSEMEARADYLEELSAKLDSQKAALGAALDEQRAQIESEVEERVVKELLASKHRPAENGYAHKTGHAPIDVSRLTRDQRAKIAKRALGGEKISF
jgi:hypothetical protein